MLPNSVIINYDTKKFAFREILCSQVFKVDRLEWLHKYWAQQRQKDRLEYKDNLVLRKLMQNLSDDSSFYKLYHYWVNEVIARRYGNKIRYTMHPKMRVHLANTESVSKVHRDVDITKNAKQINVYLPFTDVFDSCTIWAESDYGNGDYVPLNLKYGQALLWDGGYLKHCSFYNDTDHTRVSCDFRFSWLDKNLVSEPYSQIFSSRPNGKDRF